MSEKKDTNSLTGQSQRLEDIDWSFDGADTTYLTHGMHDCPERMIPQIPRTLLGSFLREGTIKNGDTVYDPFVGTGATVVESRLWGLNFIGNNRTPLTHSLSLAKAIPLQKRQIDDATVFLFSGLEDRLLSISESYEDGESTVEFDEIEIRNEWFPQLEQLLYLREKIDSLERKYTKDIARLFRVSLSNITRTVNYQQHGEFERNRIPTESRDEDNPSVFELFEEEIIENTERMRAYANRVDKSLSTTLYYADSRTATNNGEDSVKENSADIVITSLPYGDRKTTIPCEQSPLDPIITEYDKIKDINKDDSDRKDSSFESTAELEKYSPPFRETMDDLSEGSSYTEETLNLIRDYYEVMKEVKKIVKLGQPVIWVVANRTIGHVNIPIHSITKELSESLGFTHQKTLSRKNPHASGSQFNQRGDFMSDENIIIMKS